MGMEIENLLVADLAEDPDNMRLHSDENIAVLCSSLTKFGLVEKPVVRKRDNVVISGNGRLRAIKKMGWHTVDAIVVDWDDSKCKAYSLVANRTAELSQWKSFDEVMQAVEDLHGDVDISDLGFDPDEFAKQFSDNSIEEMSIEDREEPQVSKAADADKPKQGRPVQLTKEQREVFERAYTRVKEITGHEYSEGRALELMSAEYLAGA